jgi:anti-sigma factor RsiW
MTCADIENRIDAIVAGDAVADESFRSHLEGCVRCSASLALARRVEQALQARPAPAPPATFTAATLARLRRERWQSEQQMDRVFNTFLLVGGAVVVAGIAALLNLGGLAAAVTGTVEFLGRSGARPPAETIPTVTTYLLGSAFLGTAVLVWWWAERRLQTE